MPEQRNESPAAHGRGPNYKMSPVHVPSAAQGHEVEGTVPSQWWLDLKVENQRLREALTYYAEGRYPDNGETAREALGDV